VAGVGEAKCPCSCVGSEPAEVEQAGEQLSAERAGDVVALFGPVETGDSDLAGADIDPQFPERLRAHVGDGVSGSVFGEEHAVFVQCIGDGYAEPAGEVVVAAARVADRVCACSLPQRRDRLAGRDAGDRFDQLGNVRTGKREVPMPATGSRADQSTIDEPREVMTRGRRRNTGFGGKDARSQRAAVGQGEQDLCACRFREQRTDRREVRVPSGARLHVHAGDRSSLILRRRSNGLCAIVAEVITCCIEYTLDPQKLDAFEAYATRWPPIIERCGGTLVGYYLPKEGANNYAVALIDFASLADYEAYRERLAADTEAQQNFADAGESRCILVESRTFLRRV
jgi:NIPSNAP